MSNSDMRKILREFLKVTASSLKEAYGSFKREISVNFKLEAQLMKRKTRKTWKRFYSTLGSETVLNRAKSVRKYPLTTLCLIAGSCTSYVLFKSYRKKDIQKESRKRSSETIFLKFATVEYNGQVYMTPKDFLDSLLDTNFRIRSRRMVLTDQHLNNILDKTPSQEDNSPNFFRNLGTNGIISYTEYLFLLSVLVEPYSAFKINFKILDTDDSKSIDKEEFLILERVYSREWKLRRGFYKNEKYPLLRDEQLVDDESGLQRKNFVDTTLIIHFFGKTGTNHLKYEHFKKFLLNVQREVLEMEFTQFSHGLPFITELDLAKLLMKYTYLDAEYDHDNYIERLMARTNQHTAQQGISFEEFSAFISFLYKLEDFYFAVRYYMSLKRKISKVNFHEVFRILPGHKLSWQLIDTVFDIFDVDNTGYISYEDFVNVINDRLYRGFRCRVNKSRWEMFRLCIKRRTDWNPPTVFYRKKKSLRVNAAQRTARRNVINITE